jgi:hypothetical protein
MISIPNKGSLLALFVVAFAAVSSLRAGDAYSSALMEEIKILYPVISQAPRDHWEALTPKQAQEYQQSKARWLELGQQADQGLVLLLQDERYRHEHPSLFMAVCNERLIDLARPTLRAIINEGLKERAEALTGSEFGKAITCLRWWANTEDLTLLEKVREKFGDYESIVEDIKLAHEWMARRANGERPPFVQFETSSIPQGETSVEKMKPGASGPDKRPPNQWPIAPKPTNEHTAATQERGNTSWLIWLLVVIAATVGAVWVFLRKSK